MRKVAEEPTTKITMLAQHKPTPVLTTKVVTGLFYLFRIRDPMRKAAEALLVQLKP